MTDGKALLSEELLNQVQATAREQNREPAELVEEAVGKYLASQRLARFAERAEPKGRARNVREEDIPRLVEEVRRENDSRGR